MTTAPRDGFVQRLRQRKLAQWALVYLAGAWVLLQALAMAADAFAWPTLVQRAAWVLFPIGLLIVLVLAWYHGERGHQRIGGVELLMLAALLAIAGAAVTLVASRDNGAAQPESANASTPASDDGDGASVVVLPFADLSAARDQEYFADGLTEEILNALVRIPKLRVPARTTSFSFKGRNIPVTDIARQLRVAHVLEGSVRKDADRLRITAQLIDARADRHLWSEQYDRSIADVFAVQEEIAKAVAVALKLRLAGPVETADRTADNHQASADPAAYELYLRGLQAWNRRTTQSLLQAAEYYRQAVDRDSTFARAWAGLALTYVLLPEYTDTIPSVWTPRVRDAANRALALDPQLAEAHTALGYANVLDWKRSEGEREFRRAIEINPGFPTTHQWYGSTLNAMGRPDEALQQMERARELDPLSFIINANLGDQLYYAGQYEKAIARYDEAIAMNAEALGGAYKAQRAIVLIFVGRTEEALREARALLARVDEDAIMARTQGAYVLARLKPDEARPHIRSLEERARKRYVSPTMRAVVLVGLGEHERAIQLLQQAASTHDPNMLYYLNDPIFNPLHRDPRFERIREQFKASPPQ